ncbi:hypothetical protein FIBSPDRAFT_969377, partial [Athelia psychrophila]
ICHVVLVASAERADAEVPEEGLLGPLGLAVDQAVEGREREGEARARVVLLAGARVEVRQLAHLAFRRVLVALLAEVEALTLEHGLRRGAGRLLAVVDGGVAAREVERARGRDAQQLGRQPQLDARQPRGLQAREQPLLHGAHLEDREELPVAPLLRRQPLALAHALPLLQQEDALLARGPLPARVRVPEELVAQVVAVQALAEPQLGQLRREAAEQAPPPLEPRVRQDLHAHAALLHLPGRLRAPPAEHGPLLLPELDALVEQQPLEQEPQAQVELQREVLLALLQEEAQARLQRRPALGERREARVEAAQEQLALRVQELVADREAAVLSVEELAPALVVAVLGHLLAALPLQDEEQAPGLALVRALRDEEQHLPGHQRGLGRLRLAQLALRLLGHHRQILVREEREEALALRPLQAHVEHAESQLLAQLRQALALALDHLLPALARLPRAPLPPQLVERDREHQERTPPDSYTGSVTLRSLPIATVKYSIIPCKQHGR